MIDLVITERTEPFTINEVFEFIDDTCIGKMDAHELKSRIADAVQAERNKAIDDFANLQKEKWIETDDLSISSEFFEFVDDVAEQLKAGGTNG